jgi:hypothetical protein
MSNGWMLNEGQTMNGMEEGARGIQAFAGVTEGSHENSAGIVRCTSVSLTL